MLTNNVSFLYNGIKIKILLNYKKKSWKVI